MKGDFHCLAPFNKIIKICNLMEKLFFFLVSIHSTIFVLFASNEVETFSWINFIRRKLNCITTTVSEINANEILASIITARVHNEEWLNNTLGINTIECNPIPKVLFNHFWKRQFVVLHCHMSEKLCIARCFFSFKFKRGSFPY